MPLDSTGAPAPRPLFACLKRSGRKAASKREWQYSEADRLLAEIIDAGDIIGQGDTGHLWQGRAVFLLVALNARTFNRLCEYGADLEDLEDNGDAEPSTEGEARGWLR